nr:MAG TPA: hypothetical protein [Bacteriophage sp.]
MSALVQLIVAKLGNNLEVPPPSQHKVFHLLLQRLFQPLFRKL